MTASVRLVVEENTSDNFFEGFLVQARVDGETTPRGSFDVGDTSYMQTLDCTGADVSAFFVINDELKNCSLIRI